MKKLAKAIHDRYPKSRAAPGNHVLTIAK